MSEQELINKRQNQQQSSILHVLRREEKNSTVFQTHGKIFSLISSKALNITVIPSLMKLEALLRHTMSEGKEHRHFLSLRAQTFLELGINSITCGNAEWKSLKPCLQHNFPYVYQQSISVSPGKSKDLLTAKI